MIFTERFPLLRSTEHYPGRSLVKQNFRSHDTIDPELKAGALYFSGLLLVFRFCSSLSSKQD